MSIPLWAAVGLLCVEYVSLDVAVDTLALARRADGWAVTGSLGRLAMLIVCAAGGLWLVLRADRPRITNPVPLARPVGPTTVALLLAHALTFTVLWWMSARFVAPGGPPPGAPAMWLSLWTLAALGCASTALGAALPRTSLAALARAALPALAGGFTIGTSAWLAGQASALLWWPLGPLTLRAVGVALDAMLAGAVSDPARALIGSDRFQVIVDPVCSGFEGVGLMAVFVASYLVLERRLLRFPQAYLLVPLALIAAWLANVVRLVVLVLIGTFMSADVAAGGFHARAGWLLFCGVALSLVLVLQRSRFFVQEPVVGSFSHPTAAYLLPFLALVATALVTGLATTRLDLLYGARVLVVVPVLWAFRHYYRDIDWSWSWTAAAAGLVAAAAFVVLSPRPEPGAVAASRAALLQLPAWAEGTWLFFRIVGSVLVVPIAEELAFRGYLLRRLIDREFEQVSPGHLSWLALVVSSAAFGGIHHGWVGGAMAGLLYGLVQIRGRSIGHAVLAHVVSNAAIAVYVLGFRQWWLWA